jgi:translation initiation factor 4A
LQIHKVILALGEYMKVNCHACIGGGRSGSNVRDEQRKLEGVQVVVGTPGRVYDMIQRKWLRQFL